MLMNTAVGTLLRATAPEVQRLGLLRSNTVSLGEW